MNQRVSAEAATFRATQAPPLPKKGRCLWRGMAPRPAAHPGQVSLELAMRETPGNDFSECLRVEDIGAPGRVKSQVVILPCRKTEGKSDFRAY